MAGKKYRRSSSKCPEPLNTLIDLAAAATLGLVAKHKLKRDFEKGEGEESLRAARFVFGMGSLRRGGEGLVNLGGLIGIESALKDIQSGRTKKGTTLVPRRIDRYSVPEQPKKVVPKNMWRNHCEDGSEYGIDPNDYQNADDYYEALSKAKNHPAEEVVELEYAAVQEKNVKYRWRKYCEDGTAYGVLPEDYETADDYLEALSAAKVENDKNN